MSKRGVLTMAVGKQRFLEMAVDMALSLREHSSDPVALATDETLGRVVRERYPTVFDEVTRVPDRFVDGRALKYGCAECTPFEETMFIDADCILLAGVDHLWDALAGHAMTMLGELLTVQQDENHHGFSTRRLMRRFGLDRYLKTNSGIFCFRMPEARQIMEECLDCYLHEARPRLRWSILLGRWLGDEIAFGIVGGRRRLGTFPGPAPMYWPKEFDSIDLDHPTKPLLHMIWPLPDATLQRVLAGTAARRQRAAIPGDAASHWIEEVASLHKMAGRRRLLERIRPPRR